MSTLDNNDLFSFGPHSIRPETWQRSLERRGFAGVDGELLLDMGMRSRVIHQTGRLQAASAANLHALLSQIEAFVDGQLHTLTDNHNHTYDRVVVEQFEPTTPVKRGRDFWCDYAIRYRQLP